MNKNIHIKPDGTYRFDSLPKYGEPFYRFVMQGRLDKAGIMPGDIISLRFANNPEELGDCRGEILKISRNNHLAVLEKEPGRKNSIAIISMEKILDFELLEEKEPSKEGVAVSSRMEKIRKGSFRGLKLTKDCVINYTVALPWLKSRNKANLDVYAYFSKGEHKKIQTTAIGHPRIGAKETIVLNMKPEKLRELADIITVCTYTSNNMQLTIVDVINIEFEDIADGAVYNVSTTILPEILSKGNPNKWIEWLYLNHDIVGVVGKDGKAKVLFDNTNAGLAKNVLTSVTGAVCGYDLEDTMEKIENKEFPVTEFFAARNIYSASGCNNHRTAHISEAVSRYMQSDKRTAKK